MCSTNPSMGLRAYEVNRIRALADESIQLQQKTFQRWIRAKIPSESASEMIDLHSELKDGRFLMLLCLKFCGAPFTVPGESSNRFQWIENVNRVFAFLRTQFAADLSNLGAEDIIEGRIQPTLRLIRCVILAHHVYLERGKSKTTHVRSEREVKADLLQWCQQRCRKLDVDVQNFGSSWKNGFAFMSLLVDHLETAQRDFLQKSIRAEKSFDALALATVFDLAETKLRVPRLLDAEDFALSRHDEISIMTYLLTWKQSIEAQTEGVAQQQAEE